jgi:hypothetical protein
VAVTVTNETLDIRLDPVVGNPAIAAIEILPSTDIRIKAGGPGLADYSFFSGYNSVLWDGDHNYSGGQTFSSTLPIGQFLYQSVRYNAGPLDYNFLVPNGQYFVLLKFAEIQNPATGNTFNVTINGTPELNNFNALVTLGGAYTPIDKWFKIAVSGGLLNIHFDGQPEIAAIETLPPPRRQLGTAAFPGAQPAGSRSVARSDRRPRISAGACLSPTKERLPRFQLQSSHCKRLYHCDLVYGILDVPQNDFEGYGGLPGPDRRSRRPEGLYGLQ